MRYLASDCLQATNKPLIMSTFLAWDCVCVCVCVCVYVCVCVCV